MIIICPPGSCNYLFCDWSLSIKRLHLKSHLINFKFKCLHAKSHLSSFRFHSYALARMRFMKLCCSKVHQFHNLGAVKCTDFIPLWKVSDFIRTLFPEWGLWFHDFLPSVFCHLLRNYRHFNHITKATLGWTDYFALGENGPIPILSRIIDDGHIK